MVSEEEGSWWDQQAEYEGSKDSSSQKSFSPDLDPETRNEAGMAFTLGRSLPFIVGGFIAISLLSAAVFVALSLILPDGTTDSGDESSGDSDEWISTNGTILETSQYIEDAVTWERTESWQECYWDDWEEREICDTYYETYYEDGYECTVEIDYEYTVNGTVYNSSESLLFSDYSPCLDWVYIDYPRNGTVEVWYNEGDPGESRLTEPLEWDIAEGLLGVFFGCCSFFFLIFIVVSISKWQQRGSGDYTSGMESSGGSSRRRRSRRGRSGRRGPGRSRSSRRTVGRSGRRSK
ncbi:MAG: hypothetical protein CMA31_07320 [Euryarchaeota archaeon]|nr:hypothetical protein [Euryarchaeota archaeon]|tara:strand:+ start:1993 stop:2868 length:876 start_codon:yes stop_codon:yes gene_type:complete